jgi:hypothetical protein
MSALVEDAALRNITGAVPERWPASAMACQRDGRDHPFRMLRPAS